MIGSEDADTRNPRRLRPSPMPCTSFSSWLRNRLRYAIRCKPPHSPGLNNYSPRAKPGQATGTASDMSQKINPCREISAVLPVTTVTTRHRIAHLEMSQKPSVINSVQTPPNSHEFVRSANLETLGRVLADSPRSSSVDIHRRKRWTTLTNGQFF